MSRIDWNREPLTRREILREIWAWVRCLIGKHGTRASGYLDSELEIERQGGYLALRHEQCEKCGKIWLAPYER